MQMTLAEMSVLPILTTQQVIDGIRGTQDGQPLRVVWSYDPAAQPDPALVGKVYTWRGRLMSKRGVPPTEALIFYGYQNSMTIEEGIEVTMPRAGVIYHSITYLVPKPSTTAEVHDMQVLEARRAAAAAGSAAPPMARATGSAVPPMAHAQAQPAATYIPHHEWYDPATWTNVPPNFLILEIKTAVGITDATPIGRRRQFEILENLILGSSNFPNWSQTLLADAASQCIRILREHLAREAGYDMDKVYKELAVEIEDPFQAALGKAGKKETKRPTTTSRNQRARGTCFTCGATDHYANGCPLKTADTVAPSPKNALRGSRRE